MPTFKTLKETINYVEKNIANVLSREDIIFIVKKVMREVIIEAIYNKYVPNGKYPYIRRGDDGGFSDISNYNFKINVSNNYVSLTMFNDTPPSMNNTYNLDEIIYNGDMYDWTYSDIYAIQPFPRNWIDETVKRLYDSGELIKIMKKELLKNGIKLIN